MSKRLCYVVHRYAPYPGGSEAFVQNMAEESQRQGHDVTVITQEHKGDLNGVKVTSNHMKLLENSYDLIIVHGGNCSSQDTVHMNSDHIQSPILYMIILPSESWPCMKGLHNSKYIGCSTQADWDHVRKYNFENKSYYIRHSVPFNSKTIGTPNIFRKKYNIPTDKIMLLSCGGFWPHKGMSELAEICNSLPRDDIILVLTGYYKNAHYTPPIETDKVKVLYIEEKEDVAHAMADMDLYVMNSTEEGFGLVLIEAMLNKKPWISRNIAGAEKMCDYGITYHKKEHLQILLSKIETIIGMVDVEKAYKYAIENHLIEHTVADILQCIN